MPLMVFCPTVAAAPAATSIPLTTLGRPLDRRRQTGRWGKGQVVYNVSR